MAKFKLPTNAKKDDAYTNFTFLREEIRLHLSLVWTRATAFLASQSFLVTALAISVDKEACFVRLIFRICLPLLGIALSVLLFVSTVVASCHIEELWRRLKRYKFKHIIPNRAPGARASLAFTWVAPILFVAFWSIVLCCAT